MILVKDVMSRRVRTVPTGTAVKEASKRMARWKIGSLVVVKGKAPVGIVTEGDVSKAVSKGLDPRKATVPLTKRGLVTVGPGERLEAAAKLMADEGVKKLVVMDEGKVVGILTQTDVVGASFALVTSLNEMVLARYRPPDFRP
jgi:CBS domain-containing protein